jgi:hypothetical protein
MQPNKLLFFAIIGLAIAIVAAMFVANTFFGDQIPLPNGKEKISVSLVVAPQAFNQRDSAAQVTIVEATELIPISQFRTSDPQNPPATAWLAEAGFVISLAEQSDLKFTDAKSVATTSLAWGAFSDKQQALTQKYGPLSWDSLHAKATATDDFLTLVIAAPQSSAEGLAALISATAAHLKKQSLIGADIGQAEGWLDETFKENVRVPLGKPAEAFAATTGRSIGDAGLLSLASWRGVGLDKKSDFTLTPPQPNVTLDYPLAFWADSPPANQQVALAFRAFLLEPGQQQALAQFSLDQAGSPGQVSADGAAMLALQRWAERALR